MRGFEQACGLKVRTVHELDLTAATILKEYGMLTAGEVGYAFAQAARGETKAWAHREGYNVHRILGEFKRHRTQGRGR